MIDIGQSFNAPVGNADDGPVHLGAIVAGRARSCNRVEDGGLAARGEAYQSAFECRSGFLSAISQARTGEVTSACAVEFSFQRYYSSRFGGAAQSG
jgi:hypothetical protein